MALELIRVNVDLYERGAVISKPTGRWIMGWENFHSRRIVFPVEPIATLMRTYEDGISMALMDFCHIRLTAVSDAHVLPTCDSQFDFMLTDTRLDWLLGDNLPRMAAKAVTISPPYRYSRSFCAWLELWEVDGRKGMATFVTDQVDFSKLTDNP